MGGLACCPCWKIFERLNENIPPSPQAKAGGDARPKQHSKLTIFPKPPITHPRAISATLYYRRKRARALVTAANFVEERIREETGS